MRVLTLVRVFVLLTLCPGLLALPPATKSDLAAREDLEGADSISEGLVENSYEPDGITDLGFDEQEDEDEELEDTSDALDGTVDPEVVEKGDDYDASEGAAELEDDSEAFPETSEDPLENVKASDASNDSTEPEDESGVFEETSEDLVEDIEASNSVTLATADDFSRLAAWPEIPGGANCYTDADRALWKWRRHCDIAMAERDHHAGCLNYAPSRGHCCKKNGKRNKNWL